MSNVLIMGFIAWWGYKTFGIMGVVGFPVMMMGMLYFRQNGMLYVNQMKSYQAEPPRFNMPDFEEVWITCADGVKIFAWLIRHPTNSKTAPTMMFFHGNAGTIAERLPNAEGLIKHVGCNVMLVEYRGYGTSQGEPTEAGLKADAQGAIEHLKQRKDIDTENLFVFGRSLGGAVAISLAAANPGALRGVLVENTFTCIRGMAGALFPFLAVLPEPWFEALLENKWHSDDIIGDIKMPFLFLAGEQDEIVPHPQMVELWDLLGGKGRGAVGKHPEGSAIIKFPTGKHNDTWTLPGYYAPLTRFVRTTAKPGSVGSVGPAAAAAAAKQVEKEEEDEDEWDPTEILTRGTIDGLTVAELKKALKARGVDHSACVEKREMVALLLKVNSTGSPEEPHID